MSLRMTHVDRLLDREERLWRAVRRLLRKARLDPANAYHYRRRAVALNRRRVELAGRCR